MFSQITGSVRALYCFTDEEIEALEKRLSATVLRKGEFLLRAGEISRTVAFVNSGSLRHFAETESADMTLHFFTENEWVVDSQSFVSQKPSANYIQAWEECELVLITIWDIHRLMDTFPAFKMLNKVMEPWVTNLAWSARQFRLTPDERYQNLLEHHPEWIGRFPQHYIASYLGMTPETLSRVRSRTMRMTK